MLSGCYRTILSWRCIVTYGFQGPDETSKWRLLFHESGLGMSKMSILRLSATFALPTACGDMEDLRRLSVNSAKHIAHVCYSMAFSSCTESLIRWASSLSPITWTTIHLTIVTVALIFYCVCLLQKATFI